MKFKIFATWLCQKGVNYNLFMLKDDEYDDDVNIQDPTITVKHQKYKTRLYVILLAVCLYILFYINLIKIKPTTVIVSDITLDLYNKLYTEHHQTLSCPCSTITIPYENITSNDVTIHPVCSSIFVDQIWIEGLYFEEASQYGVWDFRTTAYSQFEFLSSFCSLSNEVISQTLTDIDHNELVSLYLLSEEQIRIEIDGKIEYLKNSAASRMITFLNYLRNTSNTHYFVSALNTNFIIETSSASNGFSIFFAHEVLMSDDDPYGPNCEDTVLKINATFSSQSYESIDYNNRYVMSPVPNSSTVTGFFAACTPVEAILESTLDCLYEINFNPHDSVLSSEHENISVHEYLDNLFIKNWSKQINYTKYFDLCSPSSCSYSAVERSSVVYAITLFISLYGGLIIILRLIASFSIDMFMKWKFCMKRRNDNSAVEQRINQFKFAQTIKRLNLFKNINDRTEQSIKHQKMVTRVYLILLFGSICTVCLFTSLNSENVTITITNLSMTTYNDFEDQHYSTLRCPCSNKAISYKNFLSLSPRLHQICSSHFVHNHWINILRSRRKHFPLKDWRSQLYLQVQFLSDFCRLANKTIDDAVIRYLSQLFIVSSVMHETEFNKQVNASLNQFYQSTTYNFDVMTDVLRLLMQIDQLYIQSARIIYGRVNDVNLISEVMADDGDSTQLIKVCY
ncbi:unnamed protein product [Adineta steineri]|uniref:Uncharacterized protein n=1 Tax=Adineta steineri TaxID=433720 RepID=A0A814G4C4_9BILA|nr:unnamed protein product [Adineta steineri]CAF1239697.1 unnamed protein product [Adineta steineri]